MVAEWAPWLDPQFPWPAQPGTLRWYTALDNHIHWLESGESFPHKGEHLMPRSRTFIPGKLKDNPILAATGYEATLQAMPEPLRSILLHGDFRAAMEDDPWQVFRRRGSKRPRSGGRPNRRLELNWMLWAWMWLGADRPRRSSPNATAVGLRR